MKSNEMLSSLTDIPKEKDATKNKEKRRSLRGKSKALLTFILTFVLAFFFLCCVILTAATVYNLINSENEYPEAIKIISSFAKNNGISIRDYPDELLALLEKNPETKEFVLNYPLKKDEQLPFSLEENKSSAEIPHLMQWDMRWGYEEYAGSLMGISGCGPTCLSMVAVYLTKDITYDPLYMARFAEENGYAVKNNGTQWTLMSEGAEKLGLVSEELPLHKQTMINALNDNKPIILIMGEGDFTASGHFIVLTSYDEEGFSVLDPNSKKRSSQKWTYERIEGQIRNIWCFSTE